jgi:repressor LexA
MSALTFKQARVRDFLVSFATERGYSPSYKEIGDALGMRSIGTVAKYVSALKKKGAIKNRPSRSRSIEVFSLPGIKVSCPHCQNEFRLALLPAR